MIFSTMNLRFRSISLLAFPLLTIPLMPSRAAEGPMTKAARANKQPYVSHFARPTSVDCPKVLPPRSRH